MVRATVAESRLRWIEKRRGEAGAVSRVTTESGAEGGVQERKAPEAVVDESPTLYCFETCPFCWKVRSLLHRKGIAFETVEVEPMKKAELDFSDWKAVPVFVDSDGTQVYDSNDILHYIDANLGNGSDFNRDGVDVDQDRMMAFSNDVLGKSIVPVIYASLRSSLRAMAYVTEQDQFSGFTRWKAKWIGALVMRMVGRSRAKMFDEKPDENLRTQLDVLAGAFDGDFLGGDAPDGADHANYGILRSMEGLRGASIVEEHGRVGPWYGRMKSICGI